MKARTASRIGEVEEAARLAFASMPETEVLYVTESGDDHPMRTRKDGTYRVVVSGWAASLHRCAVHRVVSPSPGATAETLRREVERQLDTLVREQRARASAGWRAAGLRAPVERLPFDQDNDGLDVEHVVTDLATVARLRAEEGDDAGVRRRISLAVNRHLRQRESVDRNVLEDVRMDRWVLTMPLRLGDRATLEGDRLYLKDRLPETVMQALGGSLDGLPLSKVVEAPGIDHLTIRSAACGRILAGDRRPYARDCATVVSLMGNTPGRVRDLLGSE